MDILVDNLWMIVNNERKIKYGCVEIEDQLLSLIKL